MSVKLEKIIEEFQIVTDKISTQVRTLALGAIAFIWIIFIGTNPLPSPLSRTFKVQFFIAGFLCLFVLFFDLLQYFFSHLYMNSLINETESKKKTEAVYNYKDVRYKLSDIFFYSKIVILFVSVLWISVLAIIYIVSFL